MFLEYSAKQIMFVKILDLIGCHGNRKAKLKKNHLRSLKGNKAALGRNV